MKIIPSITALILLTVAHAQASVVINIDGGVLYGSDTSSPLSDGRLIYAVALPTGVFSSPTTLTFVTGDNLLLDTYWVADSGVLGENGGFSASLNFNLSGGISAGQRFGIVWFPTLSNMAVPPSGGTIYGQYTDPTWLIPSDGNSDNFSFLTVSAGGTTPNSDGVAQFSVVPEPATWALLAGSLTLTTLLRRRRRRA